MSSNRSEIIGLDLGLKRTGIARASAVAKLPEPMTSVETGKVVETIKNIGEDRLQAIVVGLPRNLQGEDTEQTKWVREWVAEAKSTLGTPFFWQDEALTSHLAESRRKASSTVDIDAQAAAMILQDFLDTPAERRVAC